MSVVLLVHPNTRYQTVEFSLALAALGGALKEQGHRVFYRLLDLSWNQKWLPDDIPGETDMVGITVTSCHFDEAVALAEQISRKDSPPLIIGGGAHATFDAESLLNNGFDICVRGEGEETICHLAARCRKGVKPEEWLSGIHGISYKDSDGRIIHTRDKAPVQNLDTLPLPDWHQDDYARVIRENRLPTWDPTRHHFKNRGVKTLMIESSRGCPYKCVFCTTSKIKGKAWRGKSVQRILAEYNHFRKFSNRAWASANQTHRYLIQFPDDNFCFNMARVENFCTQLLAIPAAERPSWTIMARANKMADIQLLQRMKDAGCLRIYIGAECGYDRGLNLIKKGITLQMLTSAVNNCLTAGIPYIVLSWIIGFPWEGREEALTTIHTALQFATLKPETIKTSVFTFTPIVGADITEQMGCSLLGAAGDHERHDSWGFDHPRLTDQDLFELQMAAQWLNYLLNVTHNITSRGQNFRQKLKGIRWQINEVRTGMASHAMQHLFIALQEFLTSHRHLGISAFSRSIRQAFPGWLAILKDEITQTGVKDEP